MAIALTCAGLLAAGGTPYALSARAAEPAEPAEPAGDAIHGKVVYQACMACHSLDDDDVGPRHRGVVGRKAGAVEGYPYSPALRHSGLVWDAATLDRWLTNPQALVPGAKMFFTLPNGRDRADVIAYLAQQH
ncbi:MAG TPA: c-type cytochrome [Steroidobacteraceae bacterium]|nr:c-type cytochrome [Steroidobacteraceae bacterium]